MAVGYAKDAADIGDVEILLRIYLLSWKPVLYQTGGRESAAERLNKGRN